MNRILFVFLNVLLLSACEPVPPPMVEPGALVRTAEVKQDRLQHRLAFHGVLVPVTRARLAFQSPGVVSSRPVQMGQVVHQGELLAKHRKLMPTASERLIWGLGDGSTIAVVDTAAGRIGAAICWENYMPLLRTAMYAKGIEIWCAPTVDDRDIWQTSMAFIAYEGRNFLVSACQFQPPPSAPERRDETWPEDRPLIRGGSVIISPMGDVLAGPVYGREALVAASIDLDDIIRARYDMDPTGHYARPDIFKLSVDERERPPLSGVDNDPVEES